MFCIYLRTNSDLCHLQHKLIGFYNRDEKCLQHGTDWVFKYSRLRFVCKGLIKKCKQISELEGVANFILNLFKLKPDDGFIKSETCSCYVILINYILYNKVVSDYKFIYFIYRNEPSGSKKCGEFLD